MARSLSKLRLIRVRGKKRGKSRRIIIEREKTPRSGALSRSDASSETGRANRPQPWRLALTREKVREAAAAARPILIYMCIAQ